MGRTNYRALGLVLGVLPMAALAQTPFRLNDATSAAPTNSVGGAGAFDLISWKGGSPGAPLRYGNVIAGSERVQLGGRTLSPTQDYAMDYEAGVIYLKVAAKPGDVVSVQYRHRPGSDPNAAKQFNGIAGFRYQLAPGGLGLVMGLGLTERTAEGSVLSSNVFGFDGGLKFAGGQSKGVFLYSQRQKNNVQGGLDSKLNVAPGSALADEGDARMIVQNYSSRMLGGSFSADYQDISKNFASFGSASGLDAATLGQLQKERGLTRTGFSLQDAKIGGLGFKTGFRNVADDQGAIEWRNYGVQTGGFKFDFTSRRVDAAFNRFGDLAEGERDQLAKERGLTRQNLAAEFGQKAGRVSFNAQSITEDSTGSGIERRELAIDTSRLKLNIGDQSVKSGFNRWDSILGDEKARWGLEAGLRRQWFALDSAVFGAGTPLTFKQSTLGSESGSYRSRDAAIKSKSWSLTSSLREADAGFQSMGGMGDGEVDAHIATVASMYGPGVAGRPEDRAAFRNLSGVQRDYTAFQANPYRDWNVGFSRLGLKGSQDDGFVETGSIQTKNVSATYRHQGLGTQFTELSSLLEFERQRLGTVSGLDRTDFGLSVDLGRSRKAQFSRLKASMAEGGVRRTSASYADKRIDVSVNAREVDSAVTSANQLVDNEKDLLQSLAGFSQRDARLKWQILPNLKVDLYDFRAKNSTTQEDRKLQQATLNWKPDAKTSLDYYRMEQHSDDPVSQLFANITEKISLTRDLGKYGNLMLLDERIDYDGTTNSSPDSHRQYLSYEAKVDRRTSLRTEQTRTQFDNGDKENVSANTVSTEITKRAGVSVTDVSIDRGGDDRDEKKRNYGFWFDLGNGLRVSYGYARQMAGETAGQLTSTLAVGPNQTPNEADKVGQTGQARVGDMLLGGGYGVNQWDDSRRTQSFSNLTLGSARPINFGFLKELTFNFGYDAAADYSQWSKENRQFSISTKILGHSFGYDYRGQMSFTGDRGIDRTFRFKTNDSVKNWLVASVYYKARTLPTNQEVAVRDFNITARLNPTFEVTHKLRTNPEVFQGDAFLGSVTAADRSNEWLLDWKRSANFSVGGSWKELLNDNTGALLRTAGLTFKMNEGKGSPLTLYYGLEQADGTGLRKTTHRYSLQFDQKAGPNQSFSIFAGNVSYEHNWEDGVGRNNITVRLDYQLRF